MAQPQKLIELASVDGIPLLGFELSLHHLVIDCSHRIPVGKSNRDNIAIDIDVEVALIHDVFVHGPTPAVHETF